MIVGAAGGLVGFLAMDVAERFDGVLFVLVRFPFFFRFFFLFFFAEDFVVLHLLGLVMYIRFFI